MKLNKYKLLNPVYMMIACSLISKVLGLVRDMLMAQRFGTSIITDSYIIANSIPNVLILGFASSVLVNYIPMLGKLKENRIAIKNFNTSVINLLCILSGVIVLVFLMFSPYIVKIFAAGFDGENLVVLNNMSRVLIFSAFFILLSNIFNGYSNHYNSFVITAFSGIIVNVIAIIGIYMGSLDNYEIIVYGLLFGYFCSMIFSYIEAKKNKFSYQSIFVIKNSQTKKMLLLTIPLLLNNIIWEVNVTIDKSLSSTLGVGYITALNYADKIIAILLGIFVVAISTIIYPKLSALFFNNKKDEMRELIRNAFKSILYILIPCNLILLVFSKEIVQIIFGRGAFSQDALYNTSIAVVIYSLGLIASAFKSILFKMYYAVQDTKTPSVNVVISIIMNIIMKFILIGPLGFIGIALATSLSNVLSCILLIINYNKKVLNLSLRKIVNSAVKTCIASIGATAITLLFFNLNMISNSNVNFVICIGINVILYFIMMKILKEKVIESLTKL